MIWWKRDRKQHIYRMCCCCRCSRRRRCCCCSVSGGIGVHRCWWDSNAMWKRLWKLNSLHDSRVSLHADTFFLTNVQSGSIQIYINTIRILVYSITHTPRDSERMAYERSVRRVGRGKRGGEWEQVKEDKLRRDDWMCYLLLPLLLHTAVMEWNEVNVLMMTRWWAITYGTFSSFVRCELYTCSMPLVGKRNHRRTRELMNKRQGYNGSE